MIFEELPRVIIYRDNLITSVSYFTSFNSYILSSRVIGNIESNKNIVYPLAICSINYI